MCIQLILYKFSCVKFFYFRNADDVGNSDVVSTNGSDDENDIYGDLGDISLNSADLYSGESTESNLEENIQHKSKKIFQPNVELTSMKKYIDLDLSFEEMSDAMTTTASSFTLASTIGTYNDETFGPDRNIAQEITKCINGNIKPSPHYLQETGKTDDWTSQNSNLIKVHISIFHIR